MKIIILIIIILGTIHMIFIIFVFVIEFFFWIGVDFDVTYGDNTINPHYRKILRKIHHMTTNKIIFWIILNVFEKNTTYGSRIDAIFLTTFIIIRTITPGSSH